MRTTRHSTGHFAISHAVTVASPRPSASPIAAASGPLITSATDTSAAPSTMPRVTSSRSGWSFQYGRPSATPYTTFEARMNAPT